MIFCFIKKKNKNSRGFTLVEITVALSILTILILMVTSIGLSVARTQRIIYSLQSIHEPGRFILESLAKEIRVSSVVSVSSDGKSLSVSNYRGSIDYFFDDSSKRLLREGQYISPDNIDLTGRFYVREYSLPEHSVVTIVMKAESTGGKAEEEREVFLQTSLSAR